MANETENGQSKPAAEIKKNPPAGEVKSAAFSPIQESQTGEAMKNIDFILDVPLKVSVLLGSVRMMIRDLLQLGQGSVVELEKLAGEPMEVQIGDKLIARGEVVVVNDKFGVRLTDIVSPTERIKQLNK